MKVSQTIDISRRDENMLTAIYDVPVASQSVEVRAAACCGLRRLNGDRLSHLSPNGGLSHLRLEPLDRLVEAIRGNAWPTDHATGARPVTGTDRNRARHPSLTSHESLSPADESDQDSMHYCPWLLG